MHETRTAHQACDFLIVGDVCVDVILGDMPRVPATGVDSFASAYDITLGGSAAIVAHGLACLSNSVTLVTAMGADLFAEFLKARLTRAAVSCIDQRIAEGATGLSISFSHGGDRGFLSVPMPPAAWESASLLVRQLRPGHVHASSHPHIKGLADHFPAIVEAARNCDSTISADPAGPEATDGEPRRSFNDAPALDILFVNESEARAFTGISNVDAAANALGAVSHLVVLKRGKRGASLFQREAEPVRVPGLRVHCLDPTGAGDTFASAFLHAWCGQHRGQPDYCLRFANAAAAASIGFLGGVRSHFDLPALYAAGG